MSSPIAPKDINVNNFKYSEVKTLASGAKAVYINYGSSKLRIQTPVMFLPYGVSEGFEDKKADKKIEKKDKKYNLTLSFKGQDENPKIEVFLNKMRDIETKIINDAFDNREPWFKDDFDGNKAFVSRLFSPIIKLDKDKNTGKIIGKYPPTINFKIPYDVINDKFNFQSFNMDDNEPLDFSEIVGKLKSGKAQLIVELNSIWFAGGKFGCTWKMNAGKFKCSVNNSINFIDDSDTEKVKEDDDEEEEEDIIDDVSSKLTETRVENSDDENLESDVVSSSAPVIEKKKGRGSKK
jgi:hypothetical protein